MHHDYTPDIRSLYRLPFSKNDNPNGWLEITTHCNMRCPNCYRGCDQESIPQFHESLEEVKTNIDELIRIRNCHIISISGGEPLLHPELPEIIRYISSKGAKPWLHTNGVLLAPDLIRQLGQCGLKGIIVRVDSLKNRSHRAAEKELNREREKFAFMVAREKKIHLSFICVVNKENIEEIPDIVSWARDFSKYVDFIAFIPMRQVRFKEDDVIDTSRWIYLEDLCRVNAMRFAGLKYASFLGSQLEDSAIKWLQSVWVIDRGKVLGYASPRMVELFQVMHHFFQGKYAYKFGNGRSKIVYLSLLLFSIFFKDMRPVGRACLKAILRNPLKLFGIASIQVMCYIIPPGLVNGRRDTCDGCPDAILYKGNLYPSCGLEEAKLEMVAEEMA